ncbi:MAG: SDR family oxidoreductase, partial [Steroidobacteraceae bacterium]
RGGSIVNVASGAGRRASPGATIYSSSKAAVISITQAAATELIPHGIRVNAIAPGAVDTPMWKQVEQEFSKVLKVPVGGAEAAQVGHTPAGRMATPEDQVGAVLFLASAESAYVVGQTLNVDGGLYMN